LHPNKNPASWNWSSAMDYDYFDDFYEEDPYDAVRDALGVQYQDLPPEDIEELLVEVFEGVEPGDVENFFKSLSQFGRQAGRTLQRAAPGIIQGAVSGAASGASIGGPYGALIGALGGATIGGVSSATQPRAPSRPSRPPAPRPVPPRQPPSTPAPRPPSVAAPSSPRPQGSPAAMQFLRLLSNPTVLQALMSMTMGSAGEPAVAVSNRTVPTSAITNLLSQVAAQASEEANILQRGEGIPDYLMDSEGEFLVDPANEEERAALLLHMLNEEAMQETYDDYDDYDDYAPYEESDDFDDFDDEEDWYFDELDAAEFDIAY
jgi:hypothetical protein